ncbi:hypothetical protein RCL1_001832 [Eukaryota sp. TZLM3-RCL]
MKTFVSTDAIPISVGDNAADNDRVRRAAHQDDLWFHLHNLPSTHVILHSHGINKIPRSSINEAAQLVKYFSSRELSVVTVNYIKVRYIQGTPKLGQVILKKQASSIQVSENYDTLKYFNLVS